MKNIVGEVIADAVHDAYDGSPLEIAIAVHAALEEAGYRVVREADLPRETGGISEYDEGYSAAIEKVESAIVRD